MGQHVVHLPGQPLALGRSGGPDLGVPGGLQLGQEVLGLVVRLAQPAGHEGH